MELLERRERRVGLRDAALAAIDAREREVRLGVGRIRGGSTQERLHGSLRAVAALQNRAEMIERRREGRIRLKRFVEQRLGVFRG